MTIHSRRRNGGEMAETAYTKGLGSRQFGMTQCRGLYPKCHRASFALTKGVAALRIQLVELTAPAARPMEFQSGSTHPQSQRTHRDRKPGWGNGLMSERRS